MPKNQSGKWRTLDDLEIALVKGMSQSDFPRDYILSFFVRPGRVISPAVVSELEKKKLEVAPATAEEVQAYVNRRLNEANAEPRDHGFDPTSSIRVREVLQLSRDSRGTLPGFESLFAEFKRELPLDRAGKARIAKCLASFANHEGGYVFFGLENDGQIVGIPKEIDIEGFWDDLSDVITRNFTPFFRWERNVVAFDERRVAVAYAFKSNDKPIISSGHFSGEINPSTIYFRYNRSSEPIKPGDLMKLLHERDQRVAAASRLPENLG